jgi:hypothetical protein
MRFQTLVWQLDTRKCGGTIATKDDLDHREAAPGIPNQFPVARTYRVPAAAGKVKWNVAPRPLFAVSHKWPPCDSTMERLIARPIPEECSERIRLVCAMHMRVLGKAFVRIQRLPRAMCTSRPRDFHILRSFLVCELSLWLTRRGATWNRHGQPHGAQNFTKDVILQEKAA